MTATLAALIVFVGLVSVWPAMLSTPAFAITPQPLRVTSVPNTLKEEIVMAQKLLRDSSGPTNAQRRSHSVGWYMHLDHLPKGQTSVLIAPEVVDLTWNEDLSGRRLITAADPYWANGSTEDKNDRSPRAGTLLMDTDYPVGAFDPVVNRPPGASDGEIRTFLSAYWTPVAISPHASDIITSIPNAFSQWTLTNEQHSAILSLLLASPGVKVEGTALDRAGRPVTVLSADSIRNSDFRQLLLVSRSTGRIVGVEDVRLTASGDLPVGSVTSYTLWDTT